MKSWKKALGSLLLAGVLLVQTAIPVLAEPTVEAEEDNVLFYETFDGDVQEGWDIDLSEQIVDDGTGNKVWNVTGDWPSAYLNLGKAEWTDYSIEMDFRINHWIEPSEYNGQYDSIGISGRCSASKDRWGLYYRKRGVLELNKFYDGWGHPIMEVPFTLDTGKDYHMKLDFDGNVIRAYFAEKGQEFTEPAITYTDTESPSLTYGGVSIEGVYGDFWVDNFKVTGIEHQIPVETITLSQSEISLEAGKTASLSASVTPENASDKSLLWESADSNVAQVSDEGIVTAVAAGTTVITVTSASAPEISAQCQVEVYEVPECTTFYYVSPNGNDENPGTEESPFQTIQAARNAIRNLEALPQGGVTVYLREGEYYQGETLTFTPEDSGERDKPIVYASYPGETAVITGGQEITGWQLADENLENVSDAAKGNLYVADVEAGWRFHDLYADGKRLQVSRSTNTNDWGQWPTMVHRAAPDKEKGILATFQDGMLDGLSGSEDIELNLMPVVFWNYLPVLTEIDEESNTAYLQSMNPATFADNDYGYYQILNALKFIDEPGEWCVDSKAGKVYYWPENGNPEDSRMIAPKPYELIRFQGDEEEQNWEKQVEYITLSGLTIEYSDRVPENQFEDDWLVRNAENPDAMVYFQGTANCTITDCTLRHSGTYAVTLDHYAQNNNIIGNELGDLGCGGVQINGYGVGTTDVNHHNTVMYNNIHDTGRAPYLHSPAVSVFGSGYNTLTYNYITNVPYTAFSIMGTDHNSMSASTPDTRASYDTFGDKHRQYNIRWDELGGKDFGRWDCKEYQHSVNNVVEYNIIEEYMTDMNDGGCLYAWYPGLGNSFSFNVMHKSVKGRHMLWPLYMDDYTDGATVEGNRIWAIDQAELNKGDNPYIDNQYGWPDKPAGYDELYQSIMNQAEEAVGGFKTAPLGVPVLSSPENNAKDLAPVVDFSWNASENAAKYQLEIAFDAEFTDILVSQETTKTRIDDVELDYGKTYYWRVSALGQAGANSQSEIFVITTKEETVPEAPTEIKLENDYDAVMISWEEGYHYTYTVYRREAGTDTFEKIAENIASASYLDESVVSEKTYEYKVSASNQKGEGEASEPVAVTTRKVEVLFEDNFDNGASELWVSPQGGEVKTENGVMKYDGSWQEFFVNNDTADWSDYAFEADITITGYQDGAEEYSAIGLVSRTGLNPRQFNQLAMRKSGIVEAVMGKGNNWTTFATGSPFVVETGKTYHCRVEHLGNRVRYFIDSELIYEFETDQMRATGGIGIGFGREYAEVDNVRVVAAVPAADKTALENAIAEAAQYEEADYTKASWAVFADALEKANEVNDNAEATQEEVDAAVKALNDAIAGLEEYVTPNKTLLQKTYDYALTLSTEGVTDSAKAYFEKAVAEAKAVLDDAKATQEEVNTAWDNLLDGIWGLGLVQGDKTLLEQLIAKAEAMIPNQDKYVQDNWQLLVDALAEAKKVMADGDAMEEDVQPAAEALLNAILAQRFKADKSILEELVNKAEGMDLSGYTAESVAVFRTALYNANLVLADETLSENDQAVVDEAVTELKNAIENLSANVDDSTKSDGEDNAENQPDDTQKNDNSDELPATGDDVVWFLAAVMLCSSLIWLVVRQKQGSLK